jgi:hypothetical protein
MNCRGLRSTTACAALAIALAACTRTEEPTLNPPLGNCVATTDASCKEDVPGRGTGGQGGPADAASLDGSGATADGGVAPGTCGFESMLGQVGSRTFPQCNGCISASPCCTSSTTCFNDPLCKSIVNCVTQAGCTDSLCINQCQNGVSTSGVPNFVDFGQCVTMNCSTQCTFLNPVAIGDF